jgi:multidrug efflux pump subunit AcrB
LAVVLIYALLASQFRSFLQPPAIMLSLPLAFEWGAGAEWRSPMARAVIGGLVTSTLLTLVVVQRVVPASARACRTLIRPSCQQPVWGW